MIDSAAAFGHHFFELAADAAEPRLKNLHKLRVFAIVPAYAEFDLEMEAKALAKCELTGDTMPGKHWTSDASLMAFLQSLQGGC